MAVTLHPPDNPKRFRITRTWKGTEHQRFVPIGKDINKARKLAEELDASLAQRQRAYHLRREMEGLNVLRPGGGIIGVQHEIIRRSDRKPFARFHCKFEQNGEVIFKDFVINATRSFDEAFQLAVEFIADKRGVDKDSAVFQRMMDSKSHYQKLGLLLHDQKALAQASDDDAWVRKLSQEVACFQRKRNNRIISGHQ